ncbi:ATP-binding cassette domain-containing protein [Bifidobacterium aquikefiricola]|uniref:ATP-binding cassette domain-containing protein n=1 Tax=Bifidobacterium aquikefiricola TaxID=3059038 RepID=A0AB39U5G4_9BIFI
MSVEDTSQQETLVELHEIRKTYGVLKVLRGVELSLLKGEVLGLIGDNGAGKSTLMKVLSGTVTPDSGTILVRGKSQHFSNPKEARKEGISIVYQDLALCETLDVASNLFLGREPTIGPLLNTTKMHHDARTILNDFGVRVKSTHQKIQELSGGQRQSVAIARAASMNPQILILDEPTAALAVAEVESVLKLIHDVAAQGVGVILITHRLQDIFRVCNRVAVMYEGQVVEQSSIEGLTMDRLVSMITQETPTGGVA